jgi:hypothetical protein
MLLLCPAENTGNSSVVQFIDKIMSLVAYFGQFLRKTRGINSRSVTVFITPL